MKHYLINDFLEESPKVCFYELLGEKEYRLYMFAKLNLKELEIWGPTADFNVLQFEPIEISDIEYSILNKHEPRGCYYPFTYLVTYLIDKAEDLDIQLPEFISEITDEQLMDIIDAIAK